LEACSKQRQVHIALYSRIGAFAPVYAINQEELKNFFDTQLKGFYFGEDKIKGFLKEYHPIENFLFER